MLQTIVLALIQSVTEFLPVSSSGHLILTPRLFGWADQGMAADIALHVGTLFSVMLYFRRDVCFILKGSLDIAKRHFNLPQALFVLKLGVACIPVFLIGAVCHSYISEHFRSPKIIASTAIIFGILLYAADKKGKNEGNIETMTFKTALLIGLAQTLALIPGVSRSGITMTAARALGINREESARFSMLLSIPTIGAAGCLGIFEILTEPVGQNLSASMISLGMLFSFAGGIAAIGFLMRWLKTSSFAVFAAYRVLLGIVLFYLF
ncbi:MAG: undecaprenyl-diphosphate phosphatase [Alphaproteobacteria bacterium]|nr:undecaprenyl-diphosphate phosphatase [Alphaproteobacteria bacterium]